MIERQHDRWNNFLSGYNSIISRDFETIIPYLVIYKLDNNLVDYFITVLDTSLLGWNMRYEHIYIIKPWNTQYGSNTSINKLNTYQCLVPTNSLQPTYGHGA